MSSAYPALELPDVLKVQSLFVVPSSRNSAFVSSPPQAGMQRLAPIEMAAQSIHLASSAQQGGGGFLIPASAPASSSSGKKTTRDLEANNHKPLSSAGDSGGSVGCCHDFAGPPGHAPPGKPCVIPVSLVVPLGYACCGLGLCLCHLMGPGYMHPCALLLSPFWTLALAVHAVGMHDAVWLWLGLLTIFLLPFTILVGDMLFVAFYLGVFAVFASGRFWQSLKGVPFLMVSLSWFGLASSLVLSAVLQDQPVAQLAIAAFFALAAGIVSASQLQKITISFR